MSFILISFVPFGGFVALDHKWLLEGRPGQFVLCHQPGSQIKTVMTL